MSCTPVKRKTMPSRQDSSSSKVAKGLSLEAQLTKCIEKTRDLTSEVFKKNSDLEKRIDVQDIERAALEAKLMKEQEKCKTGEKEKAELTRENDQMKIKMTQLEDNAERLSTELQLKEAKLKDLDNEMQKLLQEKTSFKCRLQSIIRDISTSKDIDLDMAQEIEESADIQNKKRANDQDSINEENNSTKRLKIIDSTVPNDSTAPNDSTVLHNGSLDNPNGEPQPIVENQSDVTLAGEANCISIGNDSSKTDLDATTVDQSNEKSAPEVENPIQEKRRNFRKNIKAIMNFEDLAPETKEAFRREKERKKQYGQRLQKYNETYGALPGERNQLDQLVLDFDFETKRELLSVNKIIASKLKPHQCQGVKFMWDACFESIKKLHSSNGGGCILSHCMGLGKTLQVVALTHTLMMNVAKTKVEKVLIVCPVNVILNWLDEFKLWLKDFPKTQNVQILEMSSCVPAERIKRMQSWHDNGGVFIVGYRMFQQMYQNLQQNQNITAESKLFGEAFVDPGADLVVCDEGHLLKNPISQLSVAISKVRTSRRIILTGTPLQNNLKEYFTMIEFVKPQLLGTEREFNNRFVGPILNGQFIDSTDEDITLMKHRAFILHKLLDGCVHRRDYSVLAEFLPPKQEHVLFIRLTKLQMDLYKFYMRKCVKGNPVADLPSLRKVCNHPKVLVDFAERRKRDKAKGQKSTVETRNKSSHPIEPLSDNEFDENLDGNAEWWKTFNCNELDFTGKMLILFSILTECEARGEKLLVFSGCLSTLNVIEQFLAAVHKQNPKRKWTRDKDYLRLDGTDHIQKRKRDIATFNETTNKRARLFLISTNAGALGINLMAANRVVIFDASWNPSQDIQSIFRTYRIGQKKECFIYRLIALGTMEEKIYDRQVSKLSIAKRVIDEHQISRHYKEEDLQQLYCVENLDPPIVKRTASSTPTKDDLLDVLFQINGHGISKHHEHDSLFENMFDETLTDEEISDVWTEFEMMEV